MSAWRWVERRQERLAWAGLVVAMALAAALLLWEGRGVTFFVDEWFFGFGAATSLDPKSLFTPDNGHLAVVPILFTKASLELFGATTTLPLRLLGIAAHLSTALMLFLFVRRRLGAAGALVPAVLILFFGVAADLLIGSHGLPMLLAVATGLGALLALERGSRRWDAAAAALLVVGIGSNGLALPFVVAAVATILLAPAADRRRLWVPALPLALYFAWWLAYGGQGESDFAIANLAGLPAFAFDSLGAELAALTGLFTAPGIQGQSFDAAAGKALAGGLLVALAGLALVARPRAARAALPALLALLALWVLTGAVAGPARQPESARYLYLGGILLLLIAAEGAFASPYRSRAALLLAAVCAVGILPNVRELDYQAPFFREQSNQNRAVLGAAALLPAGVDPTTAIEYSTFAASGEVPDMGFQLVTYRDSSGRFGSPGFSLGELEATDAASREAADRFLGRALGIAVEPARGAPQGLPAGLEAGQEGGSLRLRRRCLAFAPKSPTALLRVPLPPGGLWIRPGDGAPVPLTARRFGDGFAVDAGAAAGGEASVLRLGPGAASRGWEVQLAPRQPVLVCAA